MLIWRKLCHTGSRVVNKFERVFIAAYIIADAKYILTIKVFVIRKYVLLLLNSYVAF
jgi:hypothetical protein